MSLILDSSITLSWYFEGERTDAATAVLQQVAVQGAGAPSLWRFEVANGLQKAIRRKRIDAAYCDASLADLAALTIAIDPDADHHAWTVTVDLAERHGLTVYETAYLELAQRRRLPLATLDRALRVAASIAGVPTRGIAERLVGARRHFQGEQRSPNLARHAAVADQKLRPHPL